MIRLTLNTSYAALSSDEESTEESEPFVNPTIALNEAITLISQDQWYVLPTSQLLHGKALLSCLILYSLFFPQNPEL